jgi:hypothetical protein
MGVSIKGNGYYHQMASCYRQLLAPSATQVCYIYLCHMPNYTNTPLSNQAIKPTSLPAMDLPVFFNAFFSHPAVAPFVANGTPADWDRDWEYYNQFFAELSAGGRPDSLRKHQWLHHLQSGAGAQAAVP